MRRPMPRSPVDGLVELASDAIQTLHRVRRESAWRLIHGETDTRLQALSSLVCAEGPICPQCRCSILGTSPSHCPGCGALIAWSIETRVLVPEKK